MESPKVSVPDESEQVELTPRDRQLMEDLVTALGICQASNYKAREIFNTIAEFGFTPTNFPWAYEVKPFGGAGRGLYSIKINPAVRPYALIERVEIILSALCRTGIIVAGRVGCAASNLLDVSERWRILAIQHPLQTLRIAYLEDRPQCAICHIPMTSAARALTPNKRQAHPQCIDFLNLVLIPALHHQRKVQALVAANAQLAENMKR